MKLPDVSGVYDYAGPTRDSRYRPRRFAFHQVKSVGVPIASFRSSIPSPPVPLFTLRRTPHDAQRKTRGRVVRYSFLVGLFHSLLHAGLSRRTDSAMLRSLRREALEEHGGRLRMMTRFFASTHMRRNTLALGLCLLAVLFALEAKTAWYGPANGPGTDIQNQKARPVDLPAVVSHGVSTLPLATFPLALIFLGSVGAIAGTSAHFLRSVDVDFDHIRVSTAPYFSPALFFRPPPAL
jgi:hypothetical protein